MKVSKFLSLLILPATILPVNLISCGGSGKTDPEKEDEIKITSSESFVDKTINGCSSGNTYSVSFNFTSDKVIDTTKYELKCNSTTWSAAQASCSYKWDINNLALTLTITINLTSSFSLSSNVQCSNLQVYLVDKSTQKTKTTYSFGAMRITLYEQTSSDYCIVTFNTNGGSAVSSKKVNVNSTITAPTTTKSEYSLVGWYLDGSAFNFSTKITKNIILDAYWTEQNAVDYIWNRSFSLGCWGADIEDPRYYDLGWGTCWILSDATPNNNSDYNYYIATNWHVVDGQDSVESSTTGFTVGYADSKSSSGIDPVEGYTVFDSYQFEGYDKFYFNKSSKQAIDFVVAKANFASAPSSVKTKLNKLNYQQTTQGYINRFVNTTTSTHYESNTVYLGGFPVQNDYYATWENRSLSANELDFYEGGQYTHGVNKAETIDDYSHQYISNNYYSETWMKGGASGSMLITKLNNEWTPIGIYWGGFGDAYVEDVFYPSFSIFKSDKKDFIANYI